MGVYIMEKELREKKGAEQEGESLQVIKRGKKKGGHRGGTNRVDPKKDPEKKSEKALHSILGLKEGRVTSPNRGRSIKSKTCGHSSAVIGGKRSKYGKRKREEVVGGD